MTSPQTARRSLRRAALRGTLAPLTAAVLLASAAATLPAQQDSVPAPIAGTVTQAAPVDPRMAAQNAQAEFEKFHRMHLPKYDGKRFGGRNCPEPVGMTWCYWYDEGSKLPDERPELIAERLKLLGLLDSLAKQQPGDNWINGQRIRYLIDAGRFADALAAAEECRSFGWWCDGLKGIAYHELQRYAESEAAFERVLAKMSPREQCTWRDMTPYLDEDTRRQYIRHQCGTPERTAFEARAWWFARTRYGLAGNDSRTEHFSRLVYAAFLQDAATTHATGFDEAMRELLIRFGWERGWADGGDARPPSPEQLRDNPDGTRARNDLSLRVSVIGQEATPAHRFIPPADVLTSPASSDSTEWAIQLPPVVARYHPKYASRLLMLEHQQGLFRRGDTALVVVAYDVSKVRRVAGSRLDGALVLTPGTMPSGNSTIRRDIPAKGVMTVRAPWGPLLMSAEVAADSASTLVRARYGIRPPFAIGARVSLSDLVFYTPYEGTPTSVEEVIPHLLATQKVRANEPLGVYWEAYNTNPAGEKMTISLVVAPDDDERPGRVTRAARALRLTRGTQPVSVTVEDMSARGSRTSARALQLDIRTLKPGDYLVQLEVDVAGQYVIRADRRITVTDR